MLKKSLLLMLFVALLAPWTAKAQDLADYTFSTGQDADQWITLSDGLTSIVSSGDDSYSALTDIGFSFPFGDGTYTKFWANANGIFSFSNTPASSYSNQFTTSNLSANQPKICGITKDLGVTSDGYVKYELKGTAPNRIFVCEFYLKSSSGSSGTASVKFQVQLHESDSKVVLIYGADATTSGFQIGLSQSTSDVWTINPLTHEATHTTGAVSTTYNTWPGAYRYYQFERPVWTCFKPTNLAATLTPGNGAIATLNWTAGGDETAWVLEYGTTSDFTGATSVNVTGTPSKNIKGLTSDVKHYARVKPDCDTDGSKWSDVCTFTPTDAYIVTVCDGAATNTCAPIKNGADSQTEFVYPASMLTALDGQGITSVKFFASTTSASYSNVTVYMQEVAGTTESTSAWLYNQSTAKKVYEGTTLAVADGEMVITFSEPFEFNGGNLCFNVYAETNAPSVSWKGENPGYASCGYDYYLDEPVDHPYATAQFLPKASFYFIPEAFPKPKSLTVSNVTNESATIGWTAPNTEVTGYKYQYKPAGGDWTPLKSTNALSAPLSGLTGNTEYTFQVQAIYAGGESIFASKTFTTECNVFPIPYPFSFEDSEYTDMNCWATENIVNASVADNDWVETNLGIDNAARTGDNLYIFLYVEYTAQSLPYQTLISPELSGITNGLHVEFYYRQVEDGAETFRVGYSTTDSNLDSFTWGDEISNSTTAYQRFSANYPAGTKYVAVQHTSDDQYYLFLDDFLFEEVASCLEPTNVLVDNITTTEATVSWTPGATETAWDIFVTDDQTLVPDELTTPTYTNVTENTDYPITGLTSASTYYVYVRAICSENSAWSVPATFNTECDGIDLTWHYEFEEATLPVCWNIINTNTSYNSVTLNTNSSNAHDGNNSLSLYRGSSTGDLIAVLPEVKKAYALNHYEFTFWAKGNGNAVIIGIMTDPEDASTFVQQGTTISPTSTYTKYTVRFNEYTGSGQYVAIKNTRTVGSGYTYIDDVAINPLPACMEPSDPVVSEITAHTAKVDWTGTSAEYNVDYRKAAYVASVLSEDFEDETHYNDNWIVVNNSSANSPGRNSSAGHNSSYGFRFSSYNSATTYEEHLINKNELTGLTDGIIEFYYKMSNNGYTETFKVGYSSTDNETTSFTFGENHTATTSWQLFHEAIPAGTKYISIQYTTTGCFYYIYIDDIVIGNSVAAGSWLKSPVHITTNTANLPGLLAETKYDVRVQGDCGTDGTSEWSGIVSFTTTIACPAPSGLTSSNPKSNRITLSWTNGGSSDWVVAYKLSSDTDFTEKNVATGDVTIEGNTVTYTLTGLEPEKEYNVKVQDNCEASITGDGTSAWTSEITFETLAACAKPTGVTVSNIKHYTADVAWTGDSENFTVKYRTAAGLDVKFFEGFEDATEFENWNYYAVVSTNTTNASRWGRTTSAAKTDAYGFSFNSYTTATDYNQYLISPELTVGGKLVFQYRSSSTSSGGEKFKVGYSSTNTELESFTFGEVKSTSETTWSEFSEDIPAGTKYICIHYCVTKSEYCLYIDDLEIGTTTEAGSWNTVVSTTTTANIGGLTENTKYELAVVPNCDSSMESDMVEFTTLSANEKFFITEGNWDVDANWEPTGVPTATQNVTLFADVTIPSGCVAQAKSISGTGDDPAAPTLTINDGGQLKHNNSGVRATVKKTITGYTEDNQYTNLGYYLISNPINTYISTSSTPNYASTGLLSGKFDYYDWSGSSTLEWRNYEAEGGTFSMSYGMYGYLYANENTVELTFTGTLNYYSPGYTNRYLSFNSTATAYQNWYLLGNPYVCNAYLTNGSTSTATGLPFYKMNGDGNGFEAVSAGTPIAPMEGIFYQSTTSGSVYMVRTAPAKEASNGGNLNINLAQTVTTRGAKGSRDNAIVHFGEGQQLGKFSFSDNTAKVYIPKDGKDYAVVSAESYGELPVNFKAAENGNYTLSFTADDVEFSYLHLIDNMTGNDVDLLETSSYNFDAQYTDIESRFRLVFAKGNADMGDDFGFIDANGNLLVLGIDGTATLQVIDVTGRILSSETFSGNYSKPVKAAAGVYMIRLIQGNDSRTQKIVVK